ncbi:hypothetical protein JCM8097_006592 [Rhodosporidiobolus ruineniae]
MPSSPPPLEHPDRLQALARCLDTLRSSLPTPIARVLALPFYLAGVLSAAAVGVRSVTQLCHLIGCWATLFACLECTVSAWLQRGVEIPPHQRSSFALQIEVHDSIDSLIHRSRLLEHAHERSGATRYALRRLLEEKVSDAAEREAFEATLRRSCTFYLQVLELTQQPFFDALAYLNAESFSTVPSHAPRTLATLQAETRFFYLSSLLNDVARLVQTELHGYTVAFHRIRLFLAAMLVFSPSTVSIWAATLARSLGRVDTTAIMRIMAPEPSSVPPNVRRDELAEGPLKSWLDDVDRLVAEFSLTRPLVKALHPLLAQIRAEREVVEAEQAVLDAVLDVVLTRNEVKRILRERVLEERRARTKRSRATSTR